MLILIPIWIWWLCQSTNQLDELRGEGEGTEEAGKEVVVSQSYRFWSEDHQVLTHWADQLPGYDMNPKLHSRSLQHWEQTDNRNPLPARQTESDNPPLHSQKDSVSENECVCVFSFNLLQRKIYLTHIQLLTKSLISWLHPGKHSGMQQKWLKSIYFLWVAECFHSQYHVMEKSNHEKSTTCQV